MYKDLDRPELQQIVLMVKSKKAFAQYLGVDTKTAALIWSEHYLLLPTDYVRTMAMNQEIILREIVKHGSIMAFAEFCGVSPTFVRTCLAVDQVKVQVDPDRVIRAIQKYKSIKVATRMVNVYYNICTWSEAATRRLAEERKLDLGTILDWSYNFHSNGKGRRAELAFAQIRGSGITKDMNLTDGSQADYDFEDEMYGKVNVKSSKRYKLKAKTRAADPFVWKFSTKGMEKADYFALMAYDEKGVEVLGCWMIPTRDIPSMNITNLTESTVNQNMPPIIKLVTKEPPQCQVSLTPTSPIIIS